MSRFRDWQKEYSAKLVFENYYLPVKNSMIDVLRQYKAKNKKIAIWGASIKGTSFLKIIDPKAKYIDSVLEMNENIVGKTVVKRPVLDAKKIKNGDFDIIIMMYQKHFVQNYNMLKERKINCLVHDMDQIAISQMSRQDILDRRDMENDIEKNKKITEEIQKELLPLLHEVKRVCDENDINYFLCAGSALGAVRHNGFIPWDDDIDIGMLRKDYDKFVSVARESLGDGFLLMEALDTPDYYVNHAKVFRNNTALVNKDVSHLRIHHGFYLDIFPFDTIPENEEAQDEMYQEVRTKISEFTLRKKWNAFESKNPIKRYFANYSYYNAKLKSDEKMINDMNCILKQYLDSDSNMVADLFAPYQKKLFYKIEDLIPCQMMKFEDDFYPIPANADRYLTVMYGDYMELPPEDKRYVKHTYVKFDLEHNWKEDDKWMKKAMR